MEVVMEAVTREALWVGFIRVIMAEVAMVDIITVIIMDITRVIQDMAREADRGVEDWIMMGVSRG
jgi:hypothetical protein